MSQGRGRKAQRQIRRAMGNEAIEVMQRLILIVNDLQQRVTALEAPAGAMPVNFDDEPRTRHVDPHLGAQ